MISRSEVNFDSQQITTQQCQYTALHYTALHCQCTVSHGVTQVDVYSAQCLAHSERKTHNTLCTAHATGLCVRAYVTLSWTSWDVVVLTFEEVEMVTSRELDSLSSFNISRLRLGFQRELEHYWFALAFWLLDAGLKTIRINVHIFPHACTMHMSR